MKRNPQKQTQGPFGTAGGRTRQNRQKNVEIRNTIPRILIVCEGEKTEPNYFLLNVQSQQ